MTHHLENIDNNQRIILANLAYSGMDRAIWYKEDLQRIADTLTHGDLIQAFEDVIEKGIRELLTICDMEDDLAKENTEVKE